MSGGGNPELAEWVRKEMTLERGDVLMKAKERVSKLLGVTTEAEVEFKLEAGRLARLHAPDKIILYALGKLYAHVAGYCPDETVTAPELSVHLGLPKGTVDPALKSLREARLLVPGDKGAYSMPLNRVLEVLAEIEEKLEV